MKLSRMIHRGSKQVPKEQPESHLPPSFKPLPQPQDHYRLVSILPGRPSDPIVCATKVIHLTEAASVYNTLSYCWSSQDRTRPITCDNASFKVTANLESALKRLRATDIARDFWIDQICIDQDNLTEKSQQLSLIGAIYQRSNKLLVWLGDEGDESRKTYKITQRLLQLHPPGLGDKHSNGNSSQQGRRHINLDQLKSHGLPGAKDTAWQDLRSLLSRSWFSRIWTIQEAAFATKTEVFWGKEYAVSWESMVSIVILIREYLPRTLLGWDIFFSGLPADSLYRITATKQMLETRTRQDLFNLALAYKAFGASEPRDKLYALLNQSTLLQTADYSRSIETTFHEMAYHDIVKVYQEIAMPLVALSQQQWHPYPGIAQGPALRMVALICAAGIANQQLSLPSWVPDWTVGSFPAPIWTKKTSYRDRTVTEWPGAPPKDLALENSTIINSNLAEIQWSEEDEGPKVSASLPDTLRIKGLTIDEVSRRGFAKVDLGKSLEHEDQQKGLMEWLLEADEMADLGMEASYSGGADTELFRQTLLFDESMPQPIEIQKPELLKILRFAKNPRFASMMKRKLQPWDYLQAIQNIPGRTFFVTKGGRMGLAPQTTHMYDKICVLPGFEVPLVLRPEGSEYRIVGECYAGNDDAMPGGCEYSEMTTEWIMIK